MSTKTTRHMVADYFTAANIGGIGTVYASPPNISRSPDALANVPPGVVSGAVLYVEIWHSAEIRIALGGPLAGKKTVTHSLLLHVLFKSRQPKAEDAMDDHDDLVEAVKAAIRADRTLGTTIHSPAPIFQVGEGTSGIDVQTGMPVKVGTGSTVIWSTVGVDAVEIITA